VRQAWQELPHRDRNLLEAIGADQWQVCGQALGTYADQLLRSEGRGSLSASEIDRANAALALWVPDLRVVLINESHRAFDGLDGPTPCKSGGLLFGSEALQALRRRQERVVGRRG